VRDLPRSGLPEPAADMRKRRTARSPSAASRLGYARTVEDVARRWVAGSWTA
jgi:hypothetical protein